jgi:predicted dehydrogenase
VGVIGLGVGQAHAEAFARRSDCRVTWLCDLSEDRREWARRRFPGARVTGRSAEVLRDPDVDVVSIATYDDAHASPVVEALTAGKHVFVEKPLCRTADELDRIQRAWRARRGRSQLMSNLVLRGAPLYRWLKRRLAAGDFGDLFAFDGDYLYGRLDKITRGWRSKVPDYSVMEGGGVHLIDLLLWITGQRPRTVWAAGGRLATRETPFRYDDFAAATLTFDSGLVARITANFACVHGHQHVVRAFGTKRTLIYDDRGARLQSRRDPAPPARPLFPSPLPPHKGVLIPDFVRAIRSGEGCAAETRQIFDGLRVCLAADRSRKSRREEKVDYR